jgi:aminoglycoside phosphotransferase (APT) family kinase protein
MPPSVVEQLALRYVPGEGPISVERIGSGLVNETYRVARGADRYSMRLPVQYPVDLGLDRAWECRVLERAGAAGLAPIVECCEPRCGILVSRWVEGGAWTAEQAAQPENIEKIAQLARRIHALPLPDVARTMRLEAWIAHYGQALARHAADAHPALQSALAARLAALARLPPPAPVLCHSDLHVQNLIAADHGLVLLDWEYAHVSEPFWDLAGWAANNDLRAKSRHLLLASYLGRKPEAQEAVRLQLLLWLYDYVCLLWSELHLTLRAGAAGEPAGEAIRTRAQSLAERLHNDSGGRGG